MANIENLYKSLLLTFDSDIEFLVEEKECNLTAFNSVIFLLYNLIDKYDYLLHIKVNEKTLFDYLFQAAKIYCKDYYLDWKQDSSSIDFYILKVWINIDEDELDYYSSNDAFELHGITGIQLRKLLAQTYLIFGNNNLS